MMLLTQTIANQETTETKTLEDIIDFSLTNPIDIPLGNFIFNLFLTIILTLALSYLYSKYGKSLSNRKSFANICQYLKKIFLKVLNQSQIK